MVLSLMLLAGCSTLSGGSGAAPDMTGVWAVTMKYNDGSCADVTGGSQSAMWTVNQGADGSYLVNVQGGDKMAVLWGKATASDVSLTGLTDGYPSTMTQWRLSGSSSSVSGRALQTREGKVTRPKAAEPPPTSRLAMALSSPGDEEKSTMCTVIWSVNATKQGT